MVCKLGSVCEKIGSGATPRGGKESYQDDGISLIRSQNVLDFTFSEDGLAHINDQQAKQLNNATVQAHDVLLNITGDSVALLALYPMHYYLRA
jgi:type I restriction enzyme S subunit